MEKKTFDSLKTFSDHSFVRKRIWQTDTLHSNMYCFDPGQQNSLHRHPGSDEVVVCLEGDGIVVVGTERQALKAGDRLQLPAPAQCTSGSDTSLLRGGLVQDPDHACSPSIAGDPHVSYVKFASPLQRLQPITRRPNPQIPLGLHSQGGSGNTERIHRPPGSCVTWQWEHFTD